MFLGLDYSAVAKSFELEPPAESAEAWWGLRVMEAEALKLRNDDANS